MIETQRLFLRRPMLEDFEQHERLWSEPEVYRHISGERRPREEIWRRFLQGLGTWHFFGFGYFSVLEKGSGRYLGQAGFQEAKRDITPSLEGSLEAGWVFAPWGQGQGFANEACRAMFDWARAVHPGRRVTAIVSPENTASLRLALKLGLTQGPDVTYHDHPVTVFEGWLGEAVASP
ncbi:GNAT family N-acetyltransferase [Labrys neptuniae]